MLKTGDLQAKGKTSTLKAGVHMNRFTSHFNAFFIVRTA